MINQVIGFGCSWIHGDEIIHPNPATEKDSRLYREENCTLGQLAKMFNASALNYGISGGSLQSTMWEFMRYKPDPGSANTLVVVGLTEASRQSWFTKDNRSPYMHSHWTHDHHTWHDFVKFYTVHSDCEQLWRMNYNMAVEFFRNYCQVHHIPLLMFDVFPPPSRVESVTDWNARGYIQQVHHTHGDCLAPHYHPNEKGCKLLAEKLYNLCFDAKIIA